MKKYTEMTMMEVAEIVNHGGDAKRKLDQEVANYLDTLELSSKAQEVIADTDINAMAETFGGLFASAEVEEFIAENYGE